MDLPRLLNSVFAEKVFSDEQKCIYNKNDLASLLNNYIEQDYKVLIPAHYRTQFSNTIQMPYDYKQKAEEVFIGSFSVN
jgi:hypothetical protein